MSSRPSNPICFHTHLKGFDLRANVAVSGITNIGGADNHDNQDAFFSFYDSKNTALVVGLFDGHGRGTGRDVAQAAMRYFEAQFQGYTHEDYERLQRDPEGFFQQLFASCHHVLKYVLRDLAERAGHLVDEHQPEGFLVRHNKHSGTVSIVRGGTTATIVVVLNGGQKIYSSNVGDSAALLFSMGPTLQASDVNVHGNDGADVYRQNKLLSNDSVTDGVHTHTPKCDLLVISGNHSPESASEFFRARATRCSPLDPKLPALRFVYDSSEPKNRRLPIFTMASNGDLHHNPKGDYYKNVRDEWATIITTPLTSLFPDALAFTRSLGDFHMHSYGVSCKPTVVELSLEDIVARNLGCIIDHHESESASDKHEDRRTYALNGSTERQGEHSIMLVLASDGISDNWSYDDLHSFLSDANCNKNLQQQSKMSTNLSPVDAMISSLMNANLQRAGNYFGDQADNMTAVLCHFSYGSTRPHKSEEGRTLSESFKT